MNMGFIFLAFFSTGVVSGAGLKHMIKSLIGKLFGIDFEEDRFEHAEGLTDYLNGR